VNFRDIQKITIFANGQTAYRLSVNKINLNKYRVMNLRDFKKDVEYFVGDFVDDCSLFISINPNKSSDKVESIIEEAVDLYNDMKNRANQKVEGKKGVYFASLRKEMFEKVDSLYERLSDIVANKDK